MEVVHTILYIIALVQQRESFLVILTAIEMSIILEVDIYCYTNFASLLKPIIRYIYSMYKIVEEDFLLLKNSGWSSRSLAKLRTFLDFNFGKHLRSIINKAENISDSLKDTFDYFVSGSVSTKSKTQNDYKALVSYILVGNVLNNISSQITKVVVPELSKYNIDLSDKIPEVEQPISASSREIMVQFLEGKIEDLHNLIPFDELSEKDKLDIMENRNKLLKVLSDALEVINSSKFEEEVEDVFNVAKKEYELFIENYKAKILSLANDFNEIIKLACSAEQISSFYLLSFGDYGSIKTPIKERILKIKNFFGFIDDKTIYSMRDDCINYTKALIEKLSLFIDELEKASKIKDLKQKWFIIINAYNAFATEYNNYRIFYVELYNILKTKATQNKLLKTKKLPKKDIGDGELKDFMEYSWVDIPTNIERRFPIANIIKL